MCLLREIPGHLLDHLLFWGQFEIHGLSKFGFEIRNSNVSIRNPNPNFYLVGIESSPGFSAEITGIHIFPKKRAGTIFRISESLIEHLHDGQAGIQTDQIGKCEGAHGVIHPQFHDRVDGLRCSHPLKQGIDRLIDHGHQDPVRNESRKIIGFNRRFSHLLGEGLYRVEGIGGGLKPLDDLHQLHDRHRIHEVHSDDLRRSLSGRGNFRDRDGRGIA